MMINYKISEQLKNQLDNLSHDKYDKIKNFLQELLNPKKNSKYHTEFQNFLGWIDSPEFMLKQLEGINDFINMSKSYEQFIFIGMGGHGGLQINNLDTLTKIKWIAKGFSIRAPVITSTA